MPKSTNRKTTRRNPGPKASELPDNDAGDGLRRVAAKFLADVTLKDYVGREQQRDALKQEIVNSSKCIYIYGPPGTGKTSLLKLLCRSCHLNFNIINCSAFASESLPSVMMMLLENLGITESALEVYLKVPMSKVLRQKGGLSKIFQALSKALASNYNNDNNAHHFNLIFDEIESLSRVKVPYTSITLSQFLIKFATSEKCSLRIIGIGNDLTFLQNIPKTVITTTVRDTKLVHLSFPNYSIEESIRIVTQRLSDEDFAILLKSGISKPKFEISLRKAFSVHSGDIRRILSWASEIIREAGSSAQPQSDESRWLLAFHKMKELTGNHLVSFTNQMSSLPWQNQMVLFSVVKEYSKHQKELTTSQVNAAYSRLCMKVKIHPFEDHMVLKILESLYTDGLILLDRKLPQGAPSRVGKVHCKTANVPKNRSFKTPLKSQLSKMSYASVLRSPMRPGSNPTTATTSPASCRLIYVQPTINKDDLAYVMDHQEGLTQRLVAMALVRSDMI